METAVIRQRLQYFIETAEDEKIKAMYTLLEEQIEYNVVGYTMEFKAVLDSRYADYKNGTVSITSEEADNQVQILLNSKE